LTKKNVEKTLLQDKCQEPNTVRKNYNPFVIIIAGGCSAFGHSCFGGHGKRSDGGGGEQMPPELPALETLVFPAGDVYQPLLPPRGDPLVRRALALEKMPPALRQWVSLSIFIIIKIVIVQTQKIIILKGPSCIPHN